MAYPTPFEGLTRAQRVKKLYDDALSSLGETHRLMREERAFVWKLEQYQNDTGNTRDRTRIQPRSRSLFRNAFFKASQMLKSPPYFKARPVDAQEDPLSASRARWALEHDIADPKKRYDVVRRNVALGGLTSRIGCAHIAWNSDSGPFGDVEVYDVDGTNIAWEPPFTDPHDPRCSWFLHWGEMSLDAIKRQKGWKRKDIAPNDPEPGRSDHTDGRPFDTVSRDRQRMDTQQTATVVMLWERFGGEGDTATSVELPEDQWYMVATSGPMQGQRVDYQSPDGVLPETDTLEDGTTLKRVTRQATDEQRVAYPTGKLTIVAVHSKGEPEELYAGPWPQRMRFFPYMVWQPYASPFDQISTSDVEQGWTMELVKNGTTRTWYEQIRASRGIMQLPSRDLEDYSGEPFTYTDANGIQAFYRGESPKQISYIPGPQPSPQIPAFLNYIANDIRQNEGTGDVSLSGNPEQLKGVAVGAIQQATATGNVAIDDHIATFQIAEAVLMTVWHDIQRARWSLPRWVRYLGRDGADAYARLQNTDIPAADILITTRPTLDQLSAEQLNGIKELAAIAQQNPALAAIVARKANLDPEDVAEILKAAQPPMLPGGPMNPAGMPAPGPIPAPAM